MILNAAPKPPALVKPEGRVMRFMGELAVDAVITAAIVWGLVLAGEPLVHVLSSPLFVVLTGAGLIHLVRKTFRHEATPQAPNP